MPKPPRVDLRSRVYDPNDFVTSGKWVRVSSSNVASIRYDNDNHVMWVRFLNGQIYYYSDVLPSIARRFFMSASKGKFIWALRRSGYVGVKV